MKASLKIMFLITAVISASACFVYAQPQEQPQPPADAAKSRMGDGFVERILADVRERDPDEAARLEQLREDDPAAFRMELRKYMQFGRPGRPDGQDIGFGRGGRGMPGGMGGDEGRDRIRERMRVMEADFIGWLEKNEPQKAAELAALKEKDPAGYMRRIAIEMKNYRPVMDAELTNPQLAENLKKDMVLKQQRNELLEKLRGTTDEKDKEALKTELKDIVSQRFDLIVEKKQIQYEELKKRLEEIQKNVAKSQVELEKYKSQKDDYIKKHLDELMTKSQDFDWE